MTCEEVQEQLSHDIEAARSRGVREHLLQCDDCRKLCAELRSLGDLSRLLADSVKAPSGFSCRVREKLAERSRRQLYWSPVLAGLAVAVLAGLTWLVGVEPYSAAPVLLPLSAGEIEPLPLNRPGREVQWVGLAPVITLERAGRPDGDEALNDSVKLPSRIEVRRTSLHDDAYLKYTSY